MSVAKLFKSIMKIGLVAGSFAAIVLLSAYAVIQVVSRTGRVVEVPNVVLDGYYTASRKLDEVGLRIAVEKEQYSAVVQEGHVIYQRPAAGSKVKSGRVVMVIVSKGSEKISVPDVTGEELRQVGGKVIIPPKLRLSQLHVGHVSEIHFPAKERLILAQNPPAKTPIEAGGKVNLLVSAGPRRSKYLVPDVVGMKLDEAVNRLSELNFEIRRELEYRPRAERNMVLKQDPLPNESLEEGGSVVLTISARREEKRWEHLRYLVVEYQVPFRIPPTAQQFVRIEMTDALGVETVLRGRFYPGTRITEVVSYKEKAIVKVFVEAELRQQTETDDSKKRTYVFPERWGDAYETEGSAVNPFRGLR